MEVGEEEEGNHRRYNKIGAMRKRQINRRMYTGDNASDMIGRTVGDTDQLYAYNVTNFKVRAVLWNPRETEVGMWERKLTECRDRALS